jgi:hypothetical protein
MKIGQVLTIICLVVMFSILPGAALAYATPESIVAAGKVYISNVTVDPGVFFTDDRGTITYEVANGASEQGIVVNHAMLSDADIRSVTSPYDTSSNIGPAIYNAAGNIPQTRTFSFSVIADAQEGTYYPTFSLSFRDADSLYYKTPIKVDNTPLDLTILDKPDAFSQGKKKSVSLQVANPRQNNVRNVVLEVSGDGINANPARMFIGDLAAGAKVPVNVTLTPERATAVLLTLNYDNGDNPHTKTVELPVIFGVDKKRPNPVISNVQVKTEAGIYHVTGDVNNAGLETANTVMVTSLAPAEPQDPYKTYVVGALKPDDFGSFEVTFTAGAGTTRIPVELSYKDADGNIYTSVQDVKIAASALSGSSTAGGSSSVLPVAAAIIIVFIFVGGWMYYLRRKKQ